MSLRLTCGQEISIKSVNARVRELRQRVMNMVLRGVVGMITLRGWHCPVAFSFCHEKEILIISPTCQ